MSDFVGNNLPDLHKKADPAEIKRQNHGLKTNQIIKTILDAIPEAVLILNKYRQVVFINQACLDTFGISEQEAICGLRPGEVFLCSHVEKSPHGCGTTDFCQYCGANLAITASMANTSLIKDCRITNKTSGFAIDLRVKAAPLKVGNDLYTVFSLLDVSHEKRREVLQRLFFHDILNTAGGLSGYAELMMDAQQEELEEYKPVIQQLTQRIIEQIDHQRQLEAAEEGFLSLNPVEIVVPDLLHEVVESCSKIQVAKDKKIVIDPASAHVTFTSDVSLLSRVLFNLLKNALEASEIQQVVTIGCNSNNNRIEFFVNNSTVMSEAVKHQVFQRSFSTKGPGRGLGTYSIKLFTEIYLKGTVRFTSDQKQGTTFYVSYPIQ